MTFTECNRENNGQLIKINSLCDNINTLSP